MILTLLGIVKHMNGPELGDIGSIIQTNADLLITFHTILFNKHSIKITVFEI